MKPHLGARRPHSLRRVRTRTLLLLAVACGLVILVAGVVQLLRIAGQDDAEFSPLGAEVSVGDLRVVVESYDESGGTATVAVRLGGVDDPDAAADFRLVAPVWSSARPATATTRAARSPSTPARAA